MLETSARLLRLLSLLQLRRDWPGAELADRLEVDVRTVRRDIDRLRRLGYPVASVVGTGGGYRLEAGANVPPLLLDDEEAVAVAVGLRIGAGRAPVVGVEEASLRALAKLEAVLPSRLRRQVGAIDEAIVDVPADNPGPEVPASTLTALAAACRDHECLRFDYRSHAGAGSRRLAEPHRLVTWGRKWYLVAWDRDRKAWRTFRVDRITPVRTGPRFTPRPLPEDGDVATYVSRGASAAAWRWRARVTVRAPATAVLDRINPAVGMVEAVDEATCVLLTGADSLDSLAANLGRLGWDFTVEEPAELVEELRILAARYAAAVRRPSGRTVGNRESGSSAGDLTFC
jgi:predicted DNA-binding transcriptional regulator YafY